MAHKLHDTNGFLILSIDLHEGVLTPTLTPQKFVEINALHPFWRGTNGARPTVRFNGFSSVVLWHAPKQLKPHLPIGLNLTFWIDVLFGQQECWMARLSVEICGEPAAVTLFPSYGAFALSLNTSCWHWAQLPTALTYQSGTVETTPTEDDYRHAILCVAINALIETVFTVFVDRVSGKGKSQSPRPKLKNLFKSAKKLKDNMLHNSTLEKKALNRMTREFLTRIGPWEWKANQSIKKMIRGTLNDPRFPEFVIKDMLDLPGLVKEGAGTHGGEAGEAGGIFRMDLGKILQGDLSSVPIIGPGFEAHMGLMDHFWGERER